MRYTLTALFVFVLAVGLTAATFTVVNTNDSGAGSLRRPILDANAAADANTIAFNIAGSGVHTITPLSLPPSINQPLLIDGYTQPGGAMNTNAGGGLNSVLLIEIDGTSAPNRCLTFGASDTTVRVPVINRCSSEGWSGHLPLSSRG